MIEMAENGKINAIIVKDLSRFGRDSVEQGLMVERILPLHEVKLISVLDGIDTSEKGISTILRHDPSFGYSGQENHYFSCKNFYAKNCLCSKSHHIRVDFLNEYVKNHIVEIASFANEFEGEFVKIVTSENYKRIQATQKKNRKKFDDLLLRQKEIDRIIENLYSENLLKQ
jgi:DNA invertase Pin-like site-specific DNA recombinase